MKNSEGLSKSTPQEPNHQIVFNTRNKVAEGRVAQGGSSRVASGIGEKMNETHKTPNLPQPGRYLKKEPRVQRELTGMRTTKEIRDGLLTLFSA